MKSISSKLSAAVTIGLLTMSVHAQAGCNLAGVAGKWGFSGQGTEVGTGVQYTHVGALVLKADGTGKGVMHRSMNGMYFGDIPIIISNFVMDSATCVGTATASHPPHGDMQKTFLLTNEGKELHIIDSSGGFTSLSIGKRL
jgi:hypothetical protein